MRKTLNNLFVLLSIFLLFPFSLTHTASAQNTNGSQKVPREAGIDEGMLYYWLRYGKIAPDSVAETLKFLGTGFVANPSSTNQIVNSIAAQWIYGVPPTKGVANYSTSKVDEMKAAGYITGEDASYYQSAGSASLGIATTFEPLPANQKNKTGAEKGELEKFSDLPGIILGNTNRAKNDVTLAGMAIAYASNLQAAVPAPGDMLPEQAGSRDIGKNSTGSTNSGGNVYAKTFTGAEGQITKPTSVQNALATLSQWMGTLATIANPDSTGTAVNTGVLPPPNGLTKSQQSVTSTGTSGNGSFLGKSNEVAQNGAPPKTDSSDATRLAERNIADQINNRNNQLGNQQDYLNNHPNLQNQFPPDQLGNLLDNKFPSDGSGGGGNGGGTPTPPVTPTTPDISVCDPAKATLSQQEVIDIADIMGLTLNASGWTISYFQASQFLGTTIYLGDSTSTQVVDQTLVSNPNACIWVVYAPSVSEGAYVTDARSQTDIKFLFTMP